MTQFTNISKRKINFNFSTPRTGQEIINEIRNNQYKNKNEYTITDNEEEDKLIKAKHKKIKNEAIQEVKEVNKNKDFKEACVKEDFSTQTEKKLLEFTIKNKNYYELTSHIPNKLLIKKLLPITNNIQEKKNIVKEENNIKIDEAKEKKNFYEVKLNNRNYKIKFV